MSESRTVRTPFPSFAVRSRPLPRRTAFSGVQSLRPKKERAAYRPKPGHSAPDADGSASGIRKGAGPCPDGKKVQCRDSIPQKAAFVKAGTLCTRKAGSRAPVRGGIGYRHRKSPRRKMQHRRHPLPVSSEAFPKVPLFFQADAGKVLDKTRKLCYPYNKNIVELHRFSIWHRRLNRKEGAIWKIHWLSIKTRSFISMR